MTHSPGAIRRARAAFAFIERGWPVFPLTPGAKKPLRHCRLCSSKSPDYQPHRGIDDCPHQPDHCHGFQAATTDPDRVRDWLGRFPEMNIGIATGPARLVVIDLDANKNGATPPAPFNVPGVVDGRGVFALALERYKARFPTDTVTVATPSGGLHIFWQLPDGITINKSEGAFGWDIDVRAAGSYIVAPTSTTPDGEYRRLGDVADVAPLPGWVRHHLEGTGHMPQPPAPRRQFIRSATRSAGGVKTTLADLAAQLAAAPEGQRHRVLCTTTTAAAYLVQADRCTEQDVYAEMESAGRAAGRSDSEIRAAIETAFDYVARKGAA